MAKVDLGFIQECDSWKLDCRFFPSKVGGKPAWLSLKPLPAIEDLTCKKCNKIMIFLCQIYAPYEDEEINSEIWLNNFHRTIFIFICRNGKCNERNSSENIIVLRSNFRRDNDFYDFIPSPFTKKTNFDIRKWTNLCHICGLVATKCCAKCKLTFYCSKEHQIIDWKNQHKFTCLQSKQVTRHLQSEKSSLLFTEWELVSKAEEFNHDESDYDEDEDEDDVNVSELEKYKKLKENGQTGTLVNIPESELKKFAANKIDKTFMHFKNVITADLDQIFRYGRNSKPLFIAKNPTPKNIPNCELCGCERQFEFEIMPQLLSSLGCHDLDWGVLLIYTCRNSCSGDCLYSYKKEYVFKQDVRISSFM